jgi:hypothetical protein
VYCKIKCPVGQGNALYLRIIESYTLAFAIIGGGEPLIAVSCLAKLFVGRCELSLTKSACVCFCNVMSRQVTSHPYARNVCVYMFVCHVVSRDALHCLSYTVM